MPAGDPSRVAPAPAPAVPPAGPPPAAPVPYARLRYAGVLAVTAVVAVWGAFLVPLRVGSVPVPVGLLLAAAVPLLVRRGGVLLGSRAAAAGPLLVWTLITFTLSTQRREGDVVITGSLRGVLFLAVGLVGGAAALGLHRPRAHAGR